MSLSSFTNAYVEAALWSSVDDNGEPLDKSPELELSDEALAIMKADAKAFYDAYNLKWDDDAQAGHDFWLTRNQHGAGFWDGDYPEPQATELTDAAQAYGEVDLYVGDDGKIYHYPNTPAKVKNPPTGNNTADSWNAGLAAAKGWRNPGGGRFGNDESDLTGSVIEFVDPMTGDGRIMHSTVVHHGPSTVRTRSGETIRLRDIGRVWDKAAYVRIFGKVPEGPIAGRRNPDGPDGEPSYLDVYTLGVAAGEKYKEAVMSLGLTEPTYGTVQAMYAEADEPGLGVKYAGGADGFDAFRDGFREGYMTKGYVTRTPPDWGRKENPSEPSADEIMTELKWGGKYSSFVVEKVLQAARELKVPGNKLPSNFRSMLTFSVPGAPDNSIIVRRIGRSKFYVGETQSKKTALADGLDLLANELEYAYRTGHVAQTKKELYSSLRAAGVLPPAKKFEYFEYPTAENPTSSAKAQRMAQDILARVKRAGGVHSSVLKNIGGGYDLFVYKLNSLHRDWKTHQFGVDLTASGQKIESRVYRDAAELLQGLTHAIMTKKLSGVDHLGRESNPDSESSWDESVYDRAIGWEHIGYGMARLYSMRDYEVLANIKPGPNAYPGFQVNILGTFEERLTPSASEAVEWAERKVFGRMLPQLAESRKQVENKLAAYHKGTHPHSRSNPEPSDGTPDIYRTPVTIGGKRVTIFSSGVSSRQKANIINRLFPDHSGDKQWHTRKAQEFVDLKNRAVDNHSSLWESSFRETFGRAPEPYDFRISGIGSDKLPADVKDRLRDLSRVAGAASEIAGAHAAAAGVKYHHGGHYLAHSSLGSKRNPTYEVYNYKTGEPAGRTFDTLQEAQEWIALRRAESPSIRLFWKVRKVGSAHNPEPDAADLYESFHGKPSEELLEIGEEVHYHENLAGLGTLTEIKVDCFSGYSAELKFDRDTQLCSNEEGTQLYIVGGDQSLDLKSLKFKDDEIDKDQVAIGVITEITYNTEKGFHNFKPTDYYHELGEESGYQPILTYDARSQLLTIAGGAYKIKPEGIVN